MSVFAFLFLYLTLETYIEDALSDTFTFGYHRKNRYLLFYSAYMSGIDKNIQLKKYNIPISRRRSYISTRNECLISINKLKSNINNF